MPERYRSRVGKNEGKIAVVAAARIRETPRTANETVLRFFAADAICLSRASFAVRT